MRANTTWSLKVNYDLKLIFLQRRLLRLVQMISAIINIIREVLTYTLVYITAHIWYRRDLWHGIGTRRVISILWQKDCCIYMAWLLPRTQWRMQR